MIARVDRGRGGEVFGFRAIARRSPCKAKVGCRRVEKFFCVPRRKRARATCMWLSPPLTYIVFGGWVCQRRDVRGVGEGKGVTIVLAFGLVCDA